AGPDRADRLGGLVGRRRAILGAAGVHLGLHAGRPARVGVALADHLELHVVRRDPREPPLQLLDCAPLRLAHARALGARATADLLIGAPLLHGPDSARSPAIRTGIKAASVAVPTASSSSAARAAAPCAARRSRRRRLGRTRPCRPPPAPSRPKHRRSRARPPSRVFRTSPPQHPPA